MSEFSDSYHLRTADPADVARLLRAARRYGAVLPTSTAFVPFLVDGASEAGAPIDDVVKHNPGVLVHYTYAEDHGLWIRGFDRGTCVVTIDLQRRREPGDELPDPSATAAAFAQLGVLDARKARALDKVLQSAREPATELETLRDELVMLIGLSNVTSLSCADLTHSSEKELLIRFPDVTLVLKSLRGRADKARDDEPHSPNQWCPRADMPAFMYLPVPDGPVDEALLARHVEHWMKTGDWDDDKQEGFWLLTAYDRALPARMRFLANRVMNLGLAFGHAGYREALKRTLRGILSVTPLDFDWAPYLARKKGTQRL